MRSSGERRADSFGPSRGGTRARRGTPPANNENQQAVIGSIIGGVALLLIIIIGSASSGGGRDADMEDRYNAPVVGDSGSSSSNRSGSSANRGSSSGGSYNAPVVSNTNTSRGSNAGSGTDSNRAALRNAFRPTSSNTPAMGDAAGDEDPTDVFANPDQTPINLSDRTRTAVVEIGEAYRKSVYGRSPIAFGRLFDMDRLFWEAKRRCTDKVRRELDGDRNFRVTVSNAVREAVTEHNRNILEYSEGNPYEFDLLSVTPIEGRPECVSYWRVFDPWDGMERLALWLIASKRNGGEVTEWKIYDWMWIEENRRYSWEKADGWSRSNAQLIQFNAAVDRINKLVSEDYSTVSPMAFDLYIRNPVLALYHPWLKAQKLAVWAQRDDTDPAKMKAFATGLLADPDCPEMARQIYAGWLFAQGDYDESITHCRAFIEKLGPDDDINSTLGLCHEFRIPEQRDKARAAYRQWIDVAGERPAYCHVLDAVLDIEDHRYDVAKTRLAKWVTAGLNASYLPSACESYLEQSDGAAALLELMEQLPKDFIPDGEWYRAAALYRVGKYDDAIKAYRVLEADGPEDAGLGIACCEAAAGDIDAGLDRVEALLQQNSGAPWLRAAHAGMQMLGGDASVVRRELESLRRLGDEAIHYVAQAALDRQPGVIDMWNHDELGPWLQEWYRSQTEREFEVPKD